MVKKFSDNSTWPMRALQMWLILIAAADNEQILTYGLLAQKLGYQSGIILTQMLKHIMYFCRQNGLPPLTILVVNQDTGLPGDGLVEADFNAGRELVFNLDWFSIVPPSPEELAEAYQKGTAQDSDLQP